MAKTAHDYAVEAADEFDAARSTAEKPRPVSITSTDEAQAAADLVRYRRQRGWATSPGPGRSRTGATPEANRLLADLRALALEIESIRERQKEMLVEGRNQGSKSGRWPTRSASPARPPTAGSAMRTDGLVVNATANRGRCATVGVCG
jgi:hypothetical protein